MKIQLNFVSDIFPNKEHGQDRIFSVTKSWSCEAVFQLHFSMESSDKIFRFWPFTFRLFIGGFQCSTYFWLHIYSLYITKYGNISNFKLLIFSHGWRGVVIKEVFPFYQIVYLTFSKIPILTWNTMLNGNSIKEFGLYEWTVQLRN